MSHYKNNAKARPVPICPKCGSVAEEHRTRYGLRNSCCDLWSWDRYPLVDKATHDARKAAHAAFDSLWKGKNGIHRNRAYRMLQQELFISAPECHMKLMDKKTAEKVPAAVERIRHKITNHKGERP